MNRLTALMRREFWENKGALRTTPLIIGAITVGLALMSVFTTTHIDNDLYTFKEGIRYLAEQPIEFRSMLVEQVMLASSAFFTLVLFFVVFFYLLGALYDDRKDRSILFWKSLPASDALTIASKLLTAMVIAPAAFLIALFITQALVAVIGSVMVLSVGENPWSLFISVTNPFKTWSLIAVSYFATAIWALPLYGWLLLVSSFAPRVPLLFAVLPPVIFTVLQLWIEFLKTFTLKNTLANIIGRWFANSPTMMSSEVEDGKLQVSLGVPLVGDFDHAATFGNIMDRLLSTQMLVGLIVAIVFLAGTLALRRRSTDN
jgi:ABC-2 type transport system permease protein